MQKLMLSSREPLVISLGGSLVVPMGGPDVHFLQAFRELVLDWTREGRKVVIVVGGGRTARQYIRAAENIVPLDAEDLDWLGIHATRLNGHLLRTLFRSVAYPRVVKNPMRTPKVWKQHVLIAAGWKPGWSTDYVACRIAGFLGVETMVNASDVSHVFTADPAKHADAKAIPELSWKEYRRMVGDRWDPGLSAPFDPIAARYCDRRHMTVAILDGKDLRNFSACVEGKHFKGTVLQ